MKNHPRWCGEHAVDSDLTESCTSIEEAGDWDVVLTVVTGEPPRIWAEHPDFVRVSDEATLTPQAAIELGRALILQGMRGLELAQVRESDAVSAYESVRCTEMAL
jgi:hypothetical protein